MATPYMSLTLPTPSVTLGPTYASLVNTALTTIDSHNHSPGFGQLVPVTGLSINADLSLAGMNLTTARTLRLQLQSSAPSANTDIGCFYATTAGDVFWRNGNAQAVQITSGSGLAAVGTGSISGLTAPATASFSSSSGAFSWRSNTNVAAGMDSGPLTIRDTGVSAFGITIASPAGIAGAYQLTLPAALPASSGLMSLSNTGALSVFGTVSGSNLTLAGSLTLSGNVGMSSATPTVSATTAAAGLRLVGAKAGADGSGYDVLTNTTNTRTGGFLFGCFNNGTAALNVDYQGLLTLQSQTAPLQPAGLYTAITPAANWGALNGLAYWKDAVGTVHFKGLLTNTGTGTNPGFTLPAGFRPTSTRHFSVPEILAKVFAYITIGTDGNVSVATTLSGAQQWSLDAVTFPAEA